MIRSVMDSFRCALTLARRFGEWEWRYVVEGCDGAVEFYVTSSKTIDDLADFYGGVEVHRALPRVGDGPPSHGRCPALSDRACWHEGSSSLAKDLWIPRWLRDQTGHEAVFGDLAAEYIRRFAKGMQP